MVLYKVRASHLNETFAALADPTRRAILARLASGEAGVMQLAKPFDMSIPAVAKHLAVLERAGLVKRGRRAQARPAGDAIAGSADDGCFARVARTPNVNMSRPTTNITIPHHRLMLIDSDVSYSARSPFVATP